MMKTLAFELCRWTAVAVAILFIVRLSDGFSTVSSANPQKVLEAAYTCADTTSLQPASNQIIKRLYGIDPSEYEFCALYYPLTNMDVDELLLIKYADSSQEQQIQSVAKARLQGQKNVFENYGVGQMDLLNNHSILMSDSGFAFFIINLKADESAAAFINALREEE